LRRWREQYNEGGVGKLHKYVKERNPELIAANEQILLLKSIVASQQMEIEFKDELLKKNSIPVGISAQVVKEFKKKSSSDVVYINIAAVGISTQEHILLQAL
jgi:hypothetical protein